MSNGSLHKLQSLDDPGPPPPYSTDKQNGYLPQSQQRLVDIEEKGESPTENVHVSKISMSSPQSSSTSTSSNKARLVHLNFNWLRIYNNQRLYKIDLQLPHAYN